MCGMAGLVAWKVGHEAELLAAATAMSACLVHRGPDDHGMFVDGDAGVALAHQRLSILDLSASGRQPMSSASGRHVVVFNGEIYNFRSIRRELEVAGLRFRSETDTEVLVEAIDRWGTEGTLGRLNGMFAFGVWDRRERRLWLARDRFGEKPLYYGVQKGVALFASEVKAIAKYPSFDRRVDTAAARDFFRYGHVPAPSSIYKDIVKLPPGSFTALDAGATEFRPPQRYWTPPGPARSPSLTDPDEAEERLDALLRDSVALRLVADVPVGAFLSGGIDSSLVVALAQAVGSGDARTFSIGFTESRYDEAPHARAVAAHLGTDHSELYVTPGEAMAVIPDLPRIYDEPFADSSQVPTYLVSRLARQHVTVALSGDGGDELFGGYGRYLAHGESWNRIGRLPFGARRPLASGLERLARWRGHQLAAHPPYAFRGAPLADKLAKAGHLLGLRDAAAFDEYLSSKWQRPEALVRGARPAGRRPAHAGHAGDFVQSMMRSDLERFLPDDILTKVDRATMAVSLEGRMPLLDHRVAELAAAMPMDMKIRDGEGKWILRRVLDRYVPRRLFDRPKMGFEVPVGEWARGPLRDWAEELLSERRLVEDGILDPEAVRRAWDDHLRGRADNTACVWTVLMFNAWLEQQHRASRVPA